MDRIGDCTRQATRSTQSFHLLFLRDEQRLPHPAWSVDLSGPTFQYIHDHQVGGSVVFPGAGYIEAMLAAGQAVSDKVNVILENIEFKQMLQLSKSARVELSVACSDNGTIAVHSRSGERLLVIAVCDLSSRDLTIGTKSWRSKR